MVNCINSLKITLPLFLGIQYWHYHVSAMDTKVAAPPSRTIDSLPVPCFLFSQLLTSSFFFVLFSCSRLVFLCRRLFVPIYPVAPGHFFPPRNTHTYTQDLLELIFFSSGPLLPVPPHRRLLSSSCYISLQEKELALEFSLFFFH